MKKYILLSALSLAMLGWSACQEENEAVLNMAPNGKTLTFSACVSGSNLLSKTAIAANGKSIVFTDGESMSVIPNVGDAFTISNSADDVTSFSGIADSEAFENATSFVAMYPSGGRDNGDLVMFVPEAQNVVSGSFDPKANLLIAETSSKDMTLQMHNVCSYIKVNISAEASFITVTADQPLAGKVSVSANGSAKMLKGEDAVALSGNITPGTYYIAVMPGKFTNLKITTDNESINPIEVAEFDFEAGHVYGLGIEAEVKLLSPADIVDYVNASDEEIVTLNMPLETYDHIAVMVEIGKITDKKVKLVIPEGVEELALEYEKLPENENGNSKFPQPAALIGVDFPTSVTSIGSNAFLGCSSLTNITLPESLTVIDSQAFSGCYSLASITIPDGVTKIGGWAFHNCESLASITIPESVTEIGDGVFADCSSLTSITIPKSVTVISNWAFLRCSSLTSITILKSIVSIYDSAFDSCDKLETIYCSLFIYNKYHEKYPQMVVLEGVNNSYTQITFQKQYAAMNFTPENDYSIVIFEFMEQPYELQVTITSDLFEKEESWGDAYYAAYFPAQYYLNDNTIRLNLNDVFYDNFAGLVNDRGETASKISTVAIQSTADGENVVYLKSVTSVKNDGSTVVLKNSDDSFDLVMEEIK